MSFSDIDWEAMSDDEYEYEYKEEEEGEEEEEEKEEKEEKGEERPQPRPLELLSSVVGESMCGHCGQETHAPVDCETLRLWHTTDFSGVVFIPSTLLTPVLHQLVKQVATQWNIPPVAAATLLYDGRYARSCPETECNYIAVSSRFYRFGNAHGRALFVSCDGCSTEFCFTCGEAPHDCKCRITNERHKDEGYIKNCPQCQVLIEKTGGCNHMTCRCGHEFCWLCLGDYSRGIHSCGIEWGQGLDVLGRDVLGRGLGRDIMNQYCMHVEDLPSFDLEYVCDTLAGHHGSDLPEGASLVLEKKKEIARLSHYYGRYEAHGQGQLYAASRTTDVALQRDAFFQLPDISSGTDADFLSMANERVVVVRRFLKYSYILAYFLEENTDMNRLQKEFFQHRQAMLERFTEELSRVSENATSQLDKSQVVNLMDIVERCFIYLLEFVNGIPQNESAIGGTSVRESSVSENATLQIE